MEIASLFPLSRVSFPSYFQDYRGVSNSAPPELPYELLHGDEVITETLLNLK